MLQLPKYSRKLNISNIFQFFSKPLKYRMCLKSLFFFNLQFLIKLKIVTFNLHYYTIVHQYIILEKYS